MDNTSYTAILYRGEKKIRGQASIQNRHVIFTPSEESDSGLRWDEFSISASDTDGMVAVHSALDPEPKLFVKDLKFGHELEAKMGVDVQHAAVHWWRLRPRRAAMAALRADADVAIRKMEEGNRAKPQIRIEVEA